MGIIIFNGTSSQEVGVVVEAPPDYQMAERDYEIVHVPGRNGDLIVDNGSFHNVDRTYQLAFGSLQYSFQELTFRISKWLHSASGYARLEDTYEPEYFRLASYHESAMFTNIFHRAGRAPITFDCKPQRFLKSGEVPITFATNASVYHHSEEGGMSGYEMGTIEKSIFNPTSCEALPLINVQGTGIAEIRIGEYRMTIASVNVALTIDSELQDVYSGSLNRNGDVEMPRGFPKLAPGANRVRVYGDSVTVEVIPRWWTL